jgi:hypothetical protein
MEVKAALAWMPVPRCQGWLCGLSAINEKMLSELPD